MAYAWYCEIPSSNVVPQCTHFDLVVPIGRTSSSTHCHYSLKTRQSTYNLNTLATSFSSCPTLASKMKAGITALGTEIPWPTFSLTTRLHEGAMILFEQQRVCSRCFAPDPGKILIMSGHRWATSLMEYVLQLRVARHI